VANLLLDSANWYDGSSSPPAVWNGSAYEVIGSIGAGVYYYGFSMTYPDDLVNAGDNIAFHAVSNSPDPTEISVSTGPSPFGPWTQIYSAELTSGEAVDFDSGPLPAGVDVQITVGAGDYVYTQDMTITPVSPTPDAFWTDFIGTQEVDA